MTEEAQGSKPEETSEQSASSSAEQPNVGELIAESKKYRGRAQAAEEKLAQIEKERKEADEAKLAEQGEYKTLLEQKEAELESANSKASEWENYQNAKKEKILEGMSAGQAEKYKDLDLKTLESIAEDLKINAGAGKAPADRAGQSQKGARFDGHADLKTWAMKDPKGFKNRNGDYPG